MEFAPSNYSCLAFGDSMGLIHLFSNSGNMVEPTPFNVYSRPTTFADPVETFQPIPFTDILTPLSIVPNPISNGKVGFRLRQNLRVTSLCPCPL
jgi:hypothetical protein